MKIQKGLVDQLPAGERIAVLPVRNDQQPHSDNTTMSTPVLMAERLAQRRRKEAHSSSHEFVDCDFILGSVAEVERLHSLAKYILTDHRR